MKIIGKPAKYKDIKRSICCACALLAMAMAMPAFAITFVPGDPQFQATIDSSGSVSAAFGNAGIGAGSFSDEFQFIIGENGVSSISLSTISSFFGGVTDLNIDSVTFNSGATTKTVSGPDALYEAFSGFDFSVQTGVLNSIFVSGTSGGNGSYGGSLSFQPMASRASPLPVTFTPASTTIFVPGDAEFQAVVDTSGAVSAFISHVGIGAGSFSDEFQFTLAEEGTSSVSLSTIASLFDGQTNLDIDSLTFNFGGSTKTINDADALYEAFSGFDFPVQFGVLNSILISGTSRGNGAYGGSLSFEPGKPMASVPEVETWAMMILGFGLISIPLRRRRTAGRSGSTDVVVRAYCSS